MRKILFFAAPLALMQTAPAAAQPAPDPSVADAWQIGPIIGSRNYSVGLPLRPTQARVGWYIDFPYPSVRNGHLHAVTFPHGPLTGKRRIIVRYRVDAPPGVRFVPQETPSAPATVSLYFQRRGDTWTGRGRFGSYRWYSPGRGVMQLTPGTHQISISLDEVWTNVNGVPATTDPRGFQEALADAQRLGLAFGTTEARAHGVFATGPARITVLSFRVI